MPSTQWLAAIHVQDWAREVTRYDNARRAQPEQRPTRCSPYWWSAESYSQRCCVKNSPWLQKSFPRLQAIVAEAIYDMHMNSIRMAVEWNYKDLKQMWAAIDGKNCSKPAWPLLSSSTELQCFFKSWEAAYNMVVKLGSHSFALHWTFTKSQVIYEFDLGHQLH